jgi:hypothetical protein
MVAAIDEALKVIQAQATHSFVSMSPLSLMKISAAS